MADVPSLISIADMAFRNPDPIATMEWKMEVLKQIKYDFSTYYAEF
jgi:hypothetical protein